jgi:KUP system potassium uptake protein
MTRQAIQLGWLPRLWITQTSEKGYGQIYVGVVNWFLMAATVALTLFFRKSDNLAAAYGVAVSLTMLMTSVLLFIAMREIWKWNLLTSAIVAGVFLTVDAGFVLANSLKIVSGGYIPLVLAAVVYGIMWIWHRGSVAVAERLNSAVMPVPDLLADLKARGVPRVPGTAVFLTRSRSGVPPVMIWHLRQNRSLHERVLVLTIITEASPRVDAKDRLSVTEEGDNFWRAVARYGFMERPNIPRLLEAAQQKGCSLQLDDVIYYVGHEHVVHREHGPALPKWQEGLFAAMVKNASHVTDYFRLPGERVVEIGRQISI